MHMDTDEDDDFWKKISSTVDQIINDLAEEEFGDAFLDDLEEELEEPGLDYQDNWAPEDPYSIPPPPAQPRPLPSLGGGASRSTLDPVSVWSVTRCPKGGYFNNRQQELFDLLLERWKLLTRWPKGGCFNNRQQELYDLLLERWKLQPLCQDAWFPMSAMQFPATMVPSPSGGKGEPVAVGSLSVLRQGSFYLVPLAMVPRRTRGRRT